MQQDEGKPRRKGLDIINIFLIAIIVILLVAFIVSETNINLSKFNPFQKHNTMNLSNRIEPDTSHYKPDDPRKMTKDEWWDNLPLKEQRRIVEQEIQEEEYLREQQRLRKEQRQEES